MEKFKGTKAWSKSLFHATCHVFIAQTNRYVIQDPKGSVRSQGRKRRREKEERRKRKPKGKLLPLLPAVRFSKEDQVSSSIFPYEPLRFYVLKSYFYMLGCLSYDFLILFQENEMVMPKYILVCNRVSRDRF